jgi:hypothetical protein
METPSFCNAIISVSRLLMNEGNEGYVFALSALLSATKKEKFQKIFDS